MALSGNQKSRLGPHTGGASAALFSSPPVAVPVGGEYSPVFEIDHLGIATEPTPAALKTNTRTSAATAFDHEGVLVTGEPYEIMLAGGRSEQNLMAAGEETNCEPWPTNNNVTAVGSLATPTGGTFNDYVASNQTYISTVPGRQYRAVATMWQDSSDVTHRSRLRLVENPWSGDVDANLILTTTPQRIVTGILTASTTHTYIQLFPDNSAVNPGTRAVHCVDIDIIDVTGKTNQAPGDHLTVTDHGYGVNGVKWYDTTNGNFVIDNIVYSQ